MTSRLCPTLSKQSLLDCLSVCGRQVCLTLMGQDRPTEPAPGQAGTRQAQADQNRPVVPVGPVFDGLMDCSADVGQNSRTLDSRLDRKGAK